MTNLQNWLALEHEAIWTYQLIGARVPKLADAASKQIAAHQRRRDLLTLELSKAGKKPVPTKVAYDVAAVNNAARARQLARDVESRICAICVDLVGQSTGADRELAIDGLRKAALVQVRWGGTAEPFPGLD